MRLILDFVPPTINNYIGRTNNWEYQRDKKRIHQAIIMSTIGTNPRIEKCKMRITYYFKDKGIHDPGNYDKMILDGLVQANIIIDDNYNVIKEFTTEGKTDRGHPRTEIEIEEIT